MKSLASKLSYPLALAILYLILQPHILAAGYATFSAGGDQHLIVNPILSFASKYDSFQDPLIRLWNGDFELYHSPITNIRYPFFFLWAGDIGDILGTTRHTYLITHLHHVIGGIGGYVFGRAVGVKPIAAFAGAVFFMFCQNNTLLSPFYWRLASTSWIPFGLAAVWLVSSGKAPRKGILIGAPAIAMLVFAKNTQPLAYFAYLAFFVGLAGLLTKVSKDISIKTIVPPVIGMSALVIISLLLSFPALYPMITHASEYIRWTTDGPVSGKSFRVSYEATQQFKYPLYGIWNVLVPLPKMFSIGSTFLGTGALVVIFTAFFSKKHRALTVLMSFVMVYFVINGFGDTLRLSRLTYKLPVLNSVRQLTSHYVLVVIPATILIAIGFEKLLDFRKGKSSYAILVGCTALSLVMTWYFIGHPSILGSGKNINLSGITLILAPIVLGFVACSRPGKIRYTLAAISIIMIAIPGADLRTKRTLDFETTNNYYTQQKIQDTILAWKDAARIKEGASVISFVKEKYPQDTRNISNYQINSLALFSGLRPFNVSYSPRPEQEFRYFNTIQARPERGILRGAEFILTDQDISKIPTDRKLTKIGNYGQLELFRVENPYLIGSLECARKRETKDASILSWCSVEKNYSNVTVTERSNTRFTYDIEPNGKTLLKHWGWFTPAWQANIDGRPAEIIQVETDRIAVKVQPGDSQVTFTYMPSDYKKSWYAFWLGLTLWIFTALSGINRSSKLNWRKEQAPKILTREKA